MTEFEFDCPNHYFELSPPSCDLYYHELQIDPWFNIAHSLHEKPVLIEASIEIVPKKTPTKRKSVLGASRRESISRKGDNLESCSEAPVKGNNSEEKKEKKRSSSQVTVTNENIEGNTNAVVSSQATTVNIEKKFQPVLKKKSVALAPVISSISSSISSSSSVNDIRSKDSVPVKKIKTVSSVPVTKSKVVPKTMSRGQSQAATSLAGPETVLHSVKEVREWEKITGEFG